MNPNGSLEQSVIPAKAGIQMFEKSPAKRDNIQGLSASRDVCFLLDSRLRGNDGLMGDLG